MEAITIRPALLSEWESAMALAWTTFQQKVAPSYSKEGVDSFLDFISDQTLKKMFIKDYYQVFVAVNENDTIEGVISLRDGNHISLLFVDQKFAGQGIGRKLIEYTSEYVATRQVERKFVLSVNAAPGAIPFYEKTGFFKIQEMETKNGITYLPMQKWI